MRSRWHTSACCAAGARMPCVLQMLILFLQRAVDLKEARMDDLLIRQAQPQDKAAVLAFCAHTWDWGDYIPQVWDEWLADPSGCLLVAILADRPVALMHM